MATFNPAALADAFGQNLFGDAKTRKVYSRQGDSLSHILSPEIFARDFGNKWSAVNWMDGIDPASREIEAIDAILTKTEPDGIPIHGGGGTGTGNPWEAYGFNPFDAMDLPQYQGPLSAPITEGQFSALDALKKTANADPIGMTQDTMAAISAMLGGQDIASLAEMMKTGYQTMDTYDPTNTAKSTGVIDSVLDGSANANVDANTKTLQQQTLASLLSALSAPRFDNTEYFNNARTVFESELADQTAELQEQFSGLGLDIGSTDRLNSIASNAGQARSRFGLGMADIERQSFEAAENRRLGAIAQAAGVGELLNRGSINAIQLLPAIMSNERLPFEEKMQFAREVLEPAAQRKGQASLTNAQIVAAAQQAALQAQMQAREQDIRQRELSVNAGRDVFNAESLLRDSADEQAMREYNEFVRTQGGLFDKNIEFLRSLPEGTVSVGPSTAAQGADIIGSIAEIVAKNPGALDTLKRILGL